MRHLGASVVARPVQALAVTSRMPCALYANDDDEPTPFTMIYRGVFS